MTAAPMTDPLAGRRIFVTDWPACRVVASPPAVIDVPERNETDVSEIADTISPLTASECADLRNAIFADAAERVKASGSMRAQGTPWNKWCYLTGLRYGPAFAAGIFTDDEREQLVEAFVGRAEKEGWNVPQAEAGFRNGLRAPTDAATNFTIRELSKIRQRDLMIAAVLPAVTAADITVKSTAAVLVEKLQERMKAMKVLWQVNGYHTMLSVGYAAASLMKDHIFVGSSGGLSRVTAMSQHAKEHRLTEGEVREWLERSIILLEPVPYVAAEGPGLPPLRADGKVPVNTDTVQVMREVPKRGGGTQMVGPLTAWTAKGVVNAFNASLVLPDRGEPDMEQTVWVAMPANRWPALNLKNTVDRLLDVRDGVTIQRLRGVLYGPQMLANGVIVTTSGYHLSEGSADFAGHEVAFVDVGDVAGLMKEVPIEQAVKECRDYFTTGFPFADDVDGAVTAALGFTMLSRAAYRLAPVFAFDAATWGDGKTYAAERLTDLGGVDGDKILVPPNTRDAAAEMQKRIEAAVIGNGPGAKIADDISDMNVFNTPALRTLTSSTAGLCKIRLLGVHEEANVNPGKFTFIATGNNMQISEDLGRRVLKCRLDLDKAKARGWDEAKSAALHARIKTDATARARLLSALLTVLSHVRTRGPQLPPMRNYDDWSRLCREAACLVMGADPKTAQDRVKVRDAKALEHAEVTAAIRDLIEAEQDADARRESKDRRTVDGGMLVRDIVSAFYVPSGLATFVGGAGATAVEGGHVRSLRLAFDAERASETQLNRRLAAWLRKHNERPTVSDGDAGGSYAIEGFKARDPIHRNDRFYWRVVCKRQPFTPELMPWTVPSS